MQPEMFRSSSPMSCRVSSSSKRSWIACATDLARFAVSFDGEGALLAAATREKLFARPAGGAALDDKGEPKPNCYAAGWRREEGSDGRITFTHGGALAGTSTYIVKRPDGRNWVVLFNTRRSANSDYLPTAIRPRIDAILDKLTAWPTLDLF